MIDEYPDVSGFMEVDGKDLAVPTELKAKLEQASILAEGELEEDKKITVIMDGKKIVCKGERSSGWIEKEMDFKAPSIKAKISFEINPLFFADVLTKSTTFTLGKERAKFSSGSFEHVLSLPV